MCRHERIELMRNESGPTIGAELSIACSACGAVFESLNEDSSREQMRQAFVESANKIQDAFGQRPLLWNSQIPDSIYAWHEDWAAMDGVRITDAAPGDIVTASYGPKSALPANNTVFEVIGGNALETFFQPVYTREGLVYGYEALSKVDSAYSCAISELFTAAKAMKLVSSLDVLCRGNAIRCAAEDGLQSGHELIFINICPETLMDPAHRTGITDELAVEFGVPKDKIVLEITEETAIHNYDLFTETVFYYKQTGYKIAIDDFGAGYGGLKMLSIIEPDFVKIDRHFISHIDRTAIKFNIVDSIATVCSRLGIKVIAEGIERREELEIVNDLKIPLLQGHYLGRPVRHASAETPETPEKQTPAENSSSFRVDSGTFELPAVPQ